jgi:probable HAF family extracellular repeat protein
MADLGTLGGSSRYATAVNDSGQVVGGTGGHAFLYDNGKMVDLNTLISSASGWLLESATAVNDSGQIVGYGTNSRGKTDAFLLTPLLPGDANGDGRVDVNDLTIVLAHFGRTGMGWAQGEFTGSGTVDINDLTVVLANFGESDDSSAGGIAAVPEPGVIALFAAGLVSLLAYAWRKRRLHWTAGA